MFYLDMRKEWDKTSKKAESITEDNHKKEDLGSWLNITTILVTFGKKNQMTTEEIENLPERATDTSNLTMSGDDDEMTKILRVFGIVNMAYLYFINKVIS